MTSPKGARRAAGLLQRAIPAESDPGPSPEAREAAIAAVAEALGARRRALRARRGRRLAALVAMAATVVLVAGYAVSRRAGAGAGEGAGEGPVVVGRGAGAAIRLADGSRVTGTGDAPLAVGSRVETPIDGTVHLAFPSGTELDLHEAGAVEVAETGSTQSFRLTRGALDAHVAKLSAGHRFLVRTPDAEVEVRGTRFRVSVGGATCAGAGATRVDVEEGLVVVRAGGAEARVAAGESWPRCEPPAVTAALVASAAPASSVAPVAPASSVAPVAPVAPPGVEAPAPARSAATSSASPSPNASASASSLAAQNALYEEALAQKRAGASTAAVASLDRLLERYPSGPLAESASAERMHLLAKQGSPRAAGAAREYLRRYPRGFARATAEALAGRADP